MDLPVTLRDLARKVDVRRAILPPPGIAPALLAAADELERVGAKLKAQTDAVARVQSEALAKGAEVTALAGAVATLRKQVEGTAKRARDQQADAVRLHNEANVALLAVERTRDQIAADREAVARMRHDAEVAVAEVEKVRAVVDAVMTLRARLAGLTGA